MAVNKVVFGGDTIIDLSSDTVTAEALISGTKAHAKDGTVITGTLNVQNFYTGTSEPDDSLGNDGDLYFLVEGD